MDRSGASAFVYAKASGMLAKSYIGKRTVKLFEARSLSDLWNLLFDEEVPLIPEFMLVRKIEEKAEQQFVSDFSRLVSWYEKPDEILVALLRFYDYTNLKLLVTALLKKESLPPLVDIGSFSELNYAFWPDLAKITAQSSMSWYNDIPKVEEQKQCDHRLDVQYIRQLWTSVQKLPLTERAPVENLIKTDIIFQNIIWALRLRVYYDMDVQTITSYLAGLVDNPDTNDVLAGPAVKILSKSIDVFDEWKDWEYRRLLNTYEPDTIWSVDPRWVQQAANNELAKKALKEFHRHPFTAMVLASWFKIKQNEVQNIRTAAEALRLNMSEEEVKEFASLY